MLRSNLAPLTGGEARGGIGFGGGAGYAYHLNKKMSLWTGLEVNSYSGSSYVGHLSETSSVNFAEKWSDEMFYMPEGENKQFGFDLNAIGYTVQQSAVYLQLPLLFGYEDAVPWTDWVTWYSRGGFKVGYSLSGTSQSEVDSLRLEGNFRKSFGYPLDEVKDLMGFGSYTDHHQNAPMKLGFSSIAYLEVGVKQRLAQQYNLYIGVFGEYSLYSVIKGAINDYMYEYEPVADNYNLYNLHYTPASHTTSNQSKKFYPMSFGIAVRFSFDTKRPDQSNNRMLQMRYLDF
jgi:hypothetical protein